MQTIASSEYVIRHNRALMIMAVSWAKEYNLLHKNVKWYQEKWSMFWKILKQSWCGAGSLI